MGLLRRGADWLIRLESFPLNARRQVKHRYQRARRGWSDQDLWSLDSYLAKVLAEALPKLKDAGGYPPQFEDEYEWHHILDLMTEGFALWAQRWESGVDEEVAYAKLKWSLKLFSKYFPNLWW